MVLFSALATPSRQRSEECKAEINAHRPTCAAVQPPHPHAWHMELVGRSHQGASMS